MFLLQLKYIWIFYFIQVDYIFLLYITNIVFLLLEITLIDFILKVSGLEKSFKYSRILTSSISFPLLLTSYMNFLYLL